MAHRNPINTDAVDTYVAAVAELSDNPDVRRWVTRTVRRWILRDYPNVLLVRRDPVSRAVLLVDEADEDGFDTRVYDGPLPDWADHALDHPPEDGSKLVFLRLDGRLSKRIRQVITWLDESRRPDQVAQTVERLGFPAAETHARKWRRKARQAQRRPGREAGAVPVFRHYDATVVQLTSAGALRLEGQRMNHCVGSYDVLVADAICEVYSLRDPDNKPHATIEVEPDGTVLQIKGPANRTVDLRWRAAIRDFCRERGYVVAGDAENIALLPVLAEPTTEALDNLLQSPHGRRLLRAWRFAARDTLAYADCETMVRMIRDEAHYLSDAALAGAFAAFDPGADRPLRIHGTVGYWVYDFYLPMLRVDAPLPLLNLARHGVFHRVGLAEDADLVLRAVRQRLPALAFRQADCLFNLGHRRPDFLFLDDVWGSAVDLLEEGDIDVTAQRRRRHLALRRRMNDAKARMASRSAPRSEGHEAVRTLLSDETPPYII